MDFLQDVERQLDLPRGEKARVVAELEAHWTEVYDELSASGVGPAEAARGAEQRLGAPLDIAARLNAVHNSASWKSALLCIVPFAASAVYLVASTLHLASSVRLTLLIAIGAAMLVMSARELLRGRRPMWLSTWLAAGITCLSSTIDGLSGSVSELPGNRAVAASLLVLVALVLAACWLVRRWLTPVIITCALAVLSASYLLLNSRNDSVTGPALLAMMLTNVVLLVLLARLVFQAHPYGSGARASLFLLAAFVLRFSTPANADSLWAAAVAAVSCGLAIVWFTRVPERASKSRASFFALLNAAVWNYVVWHPWIPARPTLPITAQVAIAVCFGLIFATIHQLIVTWPMRCEQTERNRLTLAR